MWKTTWVLAAVANTFVVPALGTSNCNHPPAPLCPKLNEVYDPCLSSCPPRYCGVDIAAISCAKPEVCKPGCRCRDGTLRNADGICIPAKYCPKCDNPNEVYDVCPIKCPPRECGVNIALILCMVPPKPGDAKCEPGCRCHDGFLRNSKDICIPANECPTCKGYNEVYDVCPAPCPPQRCYIDPLVRCKEPPKPGDPECKPGCRCIYGFVRNDTDVCIPPEECPPQCPVNQVYDTCVNGGCRRRKCSDTGILCIDPIECKGGCRCEDGYVLNDACDCVPVDECPPVCCKNEVFSDCINGGCLAKNCSQLGKPIPCVKIDPKYCIKGCLCIEGYLRDDDGVCIPEDKCKPPKCPVNQVYDSCANGGCRQRKCSDPGIICIDPIKCKGGCRCKDGYVVNDAGDCVPVDKCPPPECPVNQVYDTCVNGGCRRRTCSDPEILCIDPIECKCGCRCKDGYVLDDNGDCIPVENCPIKCQGANEVYDPCVQNCPPQTCESINKTYHCPLQPAVCKGGCVCKKGFLRNKIGECIAEKDCLFCLGPYEYFSCGGACDNVCKSIHEQNQTHCPIVNIDCNRKCYCERDYARDHNDICIPIKDCPVTCGGDPNAEPGCDKDCKRRCPGPKPTKCVCPIKGSCRCKDGFLYDPKTKKCVCPKDCSFKCHQPHEVYDPCPPNCPPQTCESIGKIFYCPIAPECHGECRCEDGYYRNKLGECISEADCLKCTGLNEYFSCRGACDNVCATMHKQNQTNCPIKNIKCSPMCYCDEGYARNKHGVCIPIDQCPYPQCGPNERYEEDPATYCEPLDCSEVGFPIDCPIENPVCEIPPICVCKFGYVRNECGICIPKTECPSCGGDPNAVAGSGVKCGNTCSDYNKPVNCAPMPYPNGCDCRKGFVYDEESMLCVRPEQCPPSCPVNQVYDICVNGGCRRRTCSDPDILCVDPIECEGGCRCKDGYVLNYYGDCVPIDECPLICQQPHEVYDPCPPNCPPQTCESIGKIFSCPIMLECHGECRCEDGYYRNKLGECVTEADCLRCTGPNEYFSCRGACDNVCTTLHKQNQTNCPIKNKKCNPMCYCDEGYARDKHGVCIPMDQCPRNPGCGPNERYEENPATYCEPLDCSEVGFPIDCPIENPGCEIPPICVCKFGYVRNEWGICIPKTECPSCGGDPNAVAGSGVKCGNTCSDYNKPVNCAPTPYPNGCDCRKGFIYDEVSKLCVRPEQCPPICNLNEVYDSCANGGCSKRNCSQIDDPEKCIGVKKCIGGCVCRKGYLRNSNGVCVPQEQCPRPCYGLNEYYDPCPDNCSPGTCESIGKGYSCPAKIECKGACTCKKGFYRSKIGECISEEDCLKCTGAHEYFRCWIECDNVCANIHEQNQTHCPFVNIKCNPKCYCEKDYARDKNGICIPINKCPAPPSCPVNQVYDTCVNGGCRRRTCADPEILCIDPTECKGGCRCVDGYVLNDNGYCIPVDECPHQCYGANEVYDPCMRSCPPQTCESINKTYFCPLQPAVCKGGCVCKKGYFRNKIGECITGRDCLKCSGPYEFFSCGGACDNVCNSIHRQNQTHCPIVNIVCNRKCYCESDYARDHNGICIPIKDCPSPPCGCNEKYEECLSSCVPRLCSQLGFPIPCPVSNVSSSCPTSPACVCIDDYVRNDQGVCIPMRDCPSCGGDPNAVSGGSNHCGNRCSDYNKGPIPCPLFRVFNGCDCRKGFVFDDNTGKCVLPRDCTPPCGVNEVFDTCVNGGCRRRNCSDIGELILCIDPITCKGGCRCKDGYLLSENGICVLINDCPKPTCRKNEVYDVCANGGCKKRKCSELGKPVICVDPLECIGDCVCVDGLLRNDDGLCVPEGKCTHPPCGCNEKYEECPSSCVPRHCSQLGFPIPCPVSNASSSCPTSPDCVCIDDYVRNDQGVCIPMGDCPSCGGDPNAVSGGSNHCGNRCSDYNKGPTPCPLFRVFNGCDCRKGFVFDDNTGKCVLPRDCTCQSTTPPATLNNTEIEERLNKGSIALAGEFVYQLLTSKPKSSFVVSATSLLIPLAQIAYFATGLVLEQLLKVLNLQNTAEIKSVYPGIISNYAIQKDVVFELATKYYANINFPLNSNFKEFSSSTFNASGENIDFSKNVPAAKTINSWVEEKTHNKIKDLVNPDMFNSDTRLVCVNAIYFLGDWEHQFNPNDTKEKDFYLDDTNTIKKLIMYQERYFNYYEDDGLKIQALEMLYKGGNFSLLVILPRAKGVDAVKTVAGKLRDYKAYLNIVENMKSQKVQVSMPRMFVETSSDMAEILPKANVTEMFNPNSDGFRGILEKPEPIYVSAIVQKAFIAVDETGTEAAAATGIIITTTSIGASFDATRPYLYYLLLNKVPVFCGAYFGNQ